MFVSLSREEWKENKRKKSQRELNTENHKKRQPCIRYLYLIFTVVTSDCRAHKAQHFQRPRFPYTERCWATCWRCAPESWCNSRKLIFRVEGHPFFYHTQKWVYSVSLLLLLCRKIRYWLKKGWCKVGKLRWVSLWWVSSINKDTIIRPCLKRGLGWVWCNVG